MAILKKALQRAKEEMAQLNEDLVPASNFQLQQEVMLSKTSFGQTFFTGPVKIIQIICNKIHIQFSNGTTRIIKQFKPLCLMDKFCKEGEGYFLKQSAIASLEKNHHPEDNEDLNQDQASWDPDRCHRNLNQSTRRVCVL